ncbi:hypothetical protein Avbf_03347 [Armadillidium vulgare]|nr:hypothetical protein Avbf_03347 [Armadillidium vulgare]
MASGVQRSHFLCANNSLVLHLRQTFGSETTSGGRKLTWIKGKQILSFIINENKNGSLFNDAYERRLSRRTSRRISHERYDAGAMETVFHMELKETSFLLLLNSDLLPCRGHCRGGRHTSLHRRGTEEQKKKSRDQDEEEIVIDDSSEETPEDECENVEKNPFEVQVYMRGCDPDNIKISIKDGLLRIEGSNKLTDTNSIFIRHEQTIPESVSIDNLKAFLHPEGLLTIGQMEEGIFPIQIKFEKKTLLQDLSIS